MEKNQKNQKTETGKLNKSKIYYFRINVYLSDTMHRLYSAVILLLNNICQFVRFHTYGQ